MSTLRMLALYIALDEEIHTFTYIVKKDKIAIDLEAGCHVRKLLRIGWQILLQAIKSIFNGKRASPDSQRISTKKKTPNHHIVAI